MSSPIEELRDTMARLRGAKGCPWDLEQTHRSIARCLIEETAELLETIDRHDMEHMREELGDVLLQVVFHARMAEEEGHFNFDDVAAEINEKLVRRHPHVFGDLDLCDSDSVLEQWDKIKADEKKSRPAPESCFKDLPPALPALLFAWNVFKEIDKKALPAPESADPRAIEERSRNLDEENAGALLFELAAACRKQGIDPESALRRYTLHVVSETEINWRQQQKNA